MTPNSIIGFLFMVGYAGVVVWGLLGQHKKVKK